MGQIASNGAENVNAQTNLSKKYKDLTNVQKEAVKEKVLPDGRIRYYEVERMSKKDGPTRGASMVLEYDPKTSRTRSWNECYDHSGQVNRVHPKTIDGQNVSAQHYPLTGKEL